MEKLSGSTPRWPCWCCAGCGGWCPLAPLPALPWLPPLPGTSTVRSWRLSSRVSVLSVEELLLTGRDGGSVIAFGAAAWQGSPSINSSPRLECASFDLTMSRLLARQDQQQFYCSHCQHLRSKHAGPRRPADPEEAVTSLQ